MHSDPSTVINPHFNERLSRYRAAVESHLDEFLPSVKTRPQRLYEALRYSMTAGGKRLRPVLTLATADLFSPNLSAAPAAIAVECVHTFSLIHDDLPCMDNDDLRRGQPTCHRQFDEATALLAGDALLAHAFSLLAKAYAPQPKIAVRLVAELAEACGSGGLVGGQMEDMLAENQPPEADRIDFIHRHKTGALIEKSLVLGALVGEASEDEIGIVRSAGHHLGLAFQMIDDILDGTADTATLGKTAGKDAQAGKATYVALHGLDESRRQAHRESDQAADLFASLPGDPSFLIDLVRAMEKRIN